MSVTFYLLDGSFLASVIVYDLAVAHLSIVQAVFCGTVQVGDLLLVVLATTTASGVQDLLVQEHLPQGLILILTSLDRP